MVSSAMSTRNGTIILGILAAVGMSGAAHAQTNANGRTSQVGKAVPPFTTLAIGGQRVSFDDMKGQGSPIFIYFINGSDPLSSQASNYINRIASAYSPSKTKWFGIINQPEEKVRSYQAEFNPPYQLLMDTNSSSMQLLGAQSSPTLVEIGSDGKIKREWTGLSAPLMKSINREVARANGMKPAEMDFSKLPSTTQVGLRFVAGTNNGG